MGTGWPAAFAGAFLLAGSASLAYERARPWSEEGAWWGAGLVTLAALLVTAPMMVGAALWERTDEAVDAGRVHAALLAALLALMALRASPATGAGADGFATYAGLGLTMAWLAAELAILNVAAARGPGRALGMPLAFPGLVLSLGAGSALGTLA